MPPQADFYTSVNHFVNTNELLTTLLGAAISGLFVWLVRRLLRDEGRISWRVTEDAPINQGDPPDATGRQQPSQRMWKIT